MALLSVREVTRSFGGFKAVQGVNLDVEPGSIAGLIGPNGAGKTTLFNIISGMISLDHGQVEFDGEDITGWPSWKIARNGLVRTFQIAKGFESLTVLENLALYAPQQTGENVLDAVFKSPRSSRRELEVLDEARTVAERLSLTHVLSNRALELSGGQKKLLELGRVMMAHPKIILLDEPAAGVNPTLTKVLMRHIRELADEGTTFLIVEHDMHFIRDLCDYVVVMVQGKDFLAGKFGDIVSNTAVQDAYLGKRS